MTQRHTPGPWAVDPKKPTEIFVASDEAMIASTDFFGDGAATAVEANARLIAAAPDGLAAAKLAYFTLLNQVITGAINTTQSGEAIAALAAFIAKATGPVRLKQKSPQQSNKRSLFVNDIMINQWYTETLTGKRP